MGVNCKSYTGIPSRKAIHALFLGLFVSCFAIYLIIFYLNLHSDLDQKPIEKKLQWIPVCNCSRPFFYSESTSSWPWDSYWNTNLQLSRNESSCSDEGTFYFSNQNVISFSMYFSPQYAPRDLKMVYTAGVKMNLEEMRKFYPGYSMRVYTNIPLDLEEPWCHLICNNSDLFWCRIENSPTLGNRSHMNFMIWRFLPLGDPSVDVFLSRDLDSVVTEREAAAVKDWLQLPEKKAIQLMRDKALGHNTPILGGMWGARNSYFGKAKNESVNSLLRNLLTACQNTLLTTGKGFDQSILSSV